MIKNILNGKRSEGLLTHWVSAWSNLEDDLQVEIQVLLVEVNSTTDI